MKPYEQLSLINTTFLSLQKSKTRHLQEEKKTLQYVLKYFRNPGVVFIESLDISDTHLPQHFRLSGDVAEPTLLRSWIWWSPLVTGDVYHHTAPVVPSFQWLSCNSFWGTYTVFLILSKKVINGSFCCLWSICMNRWWIIGHVFFFCFFCMAHFEFSGI